MSSAGNWAKNPYNSEASLKQHALPQLLFQDCKQNCVEFEFAAPTTDDEIKCVKNCQAKTYQAFDMYMRVQYNFAKKETWRDYVDISNYTGMEVEHSTNTGNLHTMSKASNLGHFDPNSHQQTNFAAMQSKVNRELGDLKKAAL